MPNNYPITVADRLFHDTDDSSGVSVDALVASGDCFVTLATQLDAVTHQADVPESAIITLEDSIRTLMQLQRQHTVVKKTADYRQ